MGAKIAASRDGHRALAIPQSFLHTPSDSNPACESLMSECVMCSLITEDLSAQRTRDGGVTCLCQSVANRPVSDEHGRLAALAAVECASYAALAGARRVRARHSDVRGCGRLSCRWVRCEVQRERTTNRHDGRGEAAEPAERLQIHRANRAWELWHRAQSETYW